MFDVKCLQNNINSFNRLLRAQEGISRVLPAGFLPELLAEHAGEACEEIFQPIIDKLAVFPAQNDVNNPWDSTEVKERVVLMTRLANYPTLCKLLITHPSFTPNITQPRQFEQKCILGPIFARFTDHVRQNFLNLETQTKMFHEKVVNDLQSELNELQNLLTKLFKLFVKHAREDLLRWVSHVVDINRARTRMQYHPMEVSLTTHNP